MLVALGVQGSSSEVWFAHLFFYGNWDPIRLTDMTSHIWSLCVEVQFYVGIALLVSIFSTRGLLFIPLICISFTIYRYFNGVHIAINTYYRVDEILAGSILALIYNNKLGSLTRDLWTKINPYLVCVLLIISCHPDSGWANYFRPYLAALLVGYTLMLNGPIVARVFENRFLIYIATISYALYVIHPILTHTWLGAGDTILKYEKRPLFFAVLFLAAHFSTFVFEKFFIDFGKRLSFMISNKVYQNAK
jgi:peptidoglycan/LPS O-acetylase OafA/YrhL